MYGKSPASWRQLLVRILVGHLGIPAFLLFAGYTMYFPIVWDFDNWTFQSWDWSLSGWYFIILYVVIGWGFTISTLFGAWFIAFYPWSSRLLDWIQRTRPSC